MRVALVSPYDFAIPGGVTEHVTQLDRWLRHLGHETAIVAPVSRGGDAGSPPNLWRVGGAVGVPTNGSVARIALAIGVSRAVKSVLSDFRPDVVHLHEPFMPLVPFAALRYSSAANVATFHAYSGNELGYRHGRPLLNNYAAKLNGRIAVSATARSYVSRYFPGNYLVVPNGVDVARFDSAALTVRESADKQTILFVGRLDERKGFRFLLAAFNRLSRRRRVRLVVVGAYSKWQADQFKQNLNDGSRCDVEFVGYATPESLVRHYLASDVVCAPSLGGESFGIVLLEAMAAGKPIIASRIPGYDEVVDDGKQGILIPPGNVDALATALDRVLDDRELRHSMGIHGKETAVRYAWPRIAERIASYYETTLARSSGDRGFATLMRSTP